MADLDPDTLSKLRVVDLREHLTSRGLPTSGLKAELVKRLRDALTSDDQQSGNGEGTIEESMVVDGETAEIQSFPEGSSEKSRLADSKRKELEAEEQLMKIAEEKNKRAEDERIKAEMDQRLKDEELNRSAEAEAKRRADENEKRLKAEKELISAEEKRRAEERWEVEEQERKRITMVREEERRKAEEQRLVEQMKIEEQQIKEEKRLAEEAMRRSEEEQKVREVRRMAEEEEMRKEQEMWLVAEQMRRAQEEHKKRMKAEEEKRLLEEEKQRQVAEEKQRFLVEQQQKLLAEEDKQKQKNEQEIFHMQQRAMKEKESMQAEQLSNQNVVSVAPSLPMQLTAPPPFVSRPTHSMNIMPPPPTVLISNIPPSLPSIPLVPTSHTPVLHSIQVSAPPTRFPPPPPPPMCMPQPPVTSVPPPPMSVTQPSVVSMPPPPMSVTQPSMVSLPPPPISIAQPSVASVPPPPPMTIPQPPSVVSVLPPPMSIPQPSVASVPPPMSIPQPSVASIPPPPPISIPQLLSPAPPTQPQSNGDLSSQSISNNTQSITHSEGNELDANTDEPESMDINETSSEIKLPQALEKVLALKTERAQLLGVDPDDVVQPIPASDDKSSSSVKPSVVTLVSVDEDEYAEEEETVTKNKETKNRRRKKKKKKRQSKVTDRKDGLKRHSGSSASKEPSIDIDIEYVQEVIDLSDPLYSQFMKIFEKFKLTDSEKDKEETPADTAKDAAKESVNPLTLRKIPVDLDDDDDDDDKDEDDKEEEDKPKLSKRKLKKLSRMSVAELKQKVSRPELVEMHDVTAKDPVLLLHLKASRNTVPVPRHWCFKRKYLQGKRGIEKPAFELPDFIKRTGIMEMRQALQEKEDQKTMKAKMRERVRPKLGKIDIDYQKLHDAFFKWQTKPRMTIHGDLYYEGKEFETRLKEKKPGDLSEDLRTALGMPTGPNANKCPPPWLIAMQRYGPPPSYPNLKIPGLNAPIPDSCSFGYHAGGWGKPPVDETGRPLYGDVFGTQVADNQPHIQEEEIDHTLWGELESESSEEEEDEDEEEEEEEEEKTEDETGLVTPAEGLITPSGFSSIPAGMETPDMIELRKRKIESEMEGGETPALYTILPEKKTERIGAAMMGSTHIYDLAGAIPASKLKMPGTASVPPQGIEVALDPSELEMDTAAMAARYEQTMREQQSQLEKEDLSDMVAEHAARQKNKRKKQQMDSAKPPKKYKEFKF